MHTQIGKYKVIKELGAGGFGAVYLAEDPMLGEKVAIKVFEIKDDNMARLATSATSDAGEVLRQRFLNEAKTLRQLSRNPHVVEVYDFDKMDDGTPYYVMPYLPHSLKDELGSDATNAAVIAELEPEEKPKRLPVAQCLSYLEQLLKALKDVHQAGLVHRDIKPANLLLNDRGEVQLCDFGIAKVPDADHSHSGVGMGSRNYMAPEQRQSAKHVDARSDVYSVGVITYRMITGTLPEGRFADPKEYQAAICEDLNGYILKALEQNPENRFADADEMLKALKKVKGSTDSSDDEATGTWMDEGAANIKPELKPLKEKIESLLLSHGEVRAQDFNVLKAMADVGGMDEGALNDFIQQIKEALSESDPNQQAFQKWVASINALVQKTKNRVSESERKNYLEAGITSTGRDEDTLSMIFKEKGVEAPSEKKSSKVVPILITLVVIIGGAAFGFQQFNQYQEEQAKIAAEQKIKDADHSLWKQVSTENTLSAYQRYLAELPSGIYASSARDKVEALQLQIEKQKREAEKQEIARITEIQEWLGRLNLLEDVTGYLDNATISAIESFERSENRVVTGEVTVKLLGQLERAYEKADITLWEESESAGSIEAYRRYLAQFPVGKNKENALAAIARIEQQNADAAARRQDQIAWQQALSTNTLQSYQQYLSQQPNGASVGQAQQKIREFQQLIAQDKRGWERASNLNSREAYKTYINEFPNGQYISTATSRLKAMQPEDTLSRYFNRDLETRIKGVYPSDTLKSLSFDVVAGDLKILEADGDYIKLDITPDKKPILIELQGSKLVIEEIQNNARDISNVSATITLPSKLISKFNIVNGEVTGKTGEFVGSISLVNGDIELVSSSFDGELSTVNGDITADSNIFNGEATTVTGTLNVTAETVEGKLESVTGKIYLTAESLSGDLKAGNVSDDIEVSINSSDYNLELSSNKGIRAELGSNTITPPKRNDSYKLSKRGTGYDIDVSTFNGKITIKTSTDW